MATFTPILNIQEVAPTQTSKETTINDAIVALENATNEQKAFTVGGTDVTISSLDFVSNFLLELTGTPAGSVNIIVPNSKRFFAVWNRTAHTQVIKSGTGAITVSVVADALAVITADGANNLKTVADSSTSGGGSGVTAFTALTDAFSSFSGRANQLVMVNNSANALVSSPKADLACGSQVSWTGSVSFARTNEAARVLLTGNTTLLITGWPAAGYMARQVFEIQNNGAFDITWPAACIRVGGTALPVTSGSGKKDIFVLLTFDGGATIYLSRGGADYH